MSHFHSASLEIILAQATERPEIAIETGTWKGENAMMLAHHFSGVTTIELSEVLHWRATRLFQDHTKICCLLGDSVEILPSIMQNKPTFFYLDAHGGKAAGMVEYGNPQGFPLWGELKAIEPRPEPDIIIVDDVGVFGGHSKEPLWTDVSFGTIVDALGRVTRAEILGDQLVIYRKDVRE